VGSVIAAWTIMKGAIAAWLARIINDPMNTLTLGLLIVGGGQALLFLWQLRLIRAGLADTKEAADGAKKSADISAEYLLLSKRTAERQLRAYIGVKEARIVSRDEGNTFEVEIELTNAGQTPAHHVRHHMSTGLQVIRDPPPDFKTSKRGRGEVPVSPGETFFLNRPIAIGGASGTGTIGTQRIIFGWGRVDYVDIFDVPQHITFRFRSGDAVRAHVGDAMRTIGWTMEPEDEGNSAT
jgi:hypothetical protein